MHFLLLVTRLDVEFQLNRIYCDSHKKNTFAFILQRYFFIFLHQKTPIRCSEIRVNQACGHQKTWNQQVFKKNTVQGVELRQYLLHNKVTYRHT